MWSYFERAKKVIFALILSIVPLVLLYAQSKDDKLRSTIASPVIEVAGVVEKAALGLTGSLSDWLFRYFFLADRADELLRLRAEVLKIDTMQARILNLMSEQASIRELYFKSKDVNINQMEFAKVIARAGAPMARMIRLDKGSVDGIRAKSPVIAHEGVVGQVMSVARNFCDVLLISDASSAISAKIVESNARGILRGITSNKEYLMEIRDLDGLIAVNANDIVVTSGENSLFPAGLPIGKVTEASKSSDGLFISAKIRPFVSIDQFDHVVVFLEEAESSSKLNAIEADWPLASL
jgi:rod shape-determining protein MreC